MLTYLVGDACACESLVDGGRVNRKKAIGLEEIQQIIKKIVKILLIEKLEVMNVVVVEKLEVAQMLFILGRTLSVSLHSIRI